MSNRLYSQCVSLLNQPITIHLIDGSKYFGTIQKVTPDGVFLSSLTTMRNKLSKIQTVNSFTTAELYKDQKLDVEEVFFGVFFFPFAVGFTLGFIAGSRRVHFPHHPHNPCQIRDDFW